VTARTLPACPTFEDWYQAINGRDPFPWQKRLAGQVADGADWPELVGIPTGLGKTACVDIAIWALAYQAHLHPRERTAPTRLWWVVNRRLLVDDTYRHAERIAAHLAGTETGPIAAVASRLRDLSRGGDHVMTPPLETVRLRGGNLRGGSRTATSRYRRPSSPAQPAVICSTIPMFGSRVLFRGYGSSRVMRPIDAALAYTDSLVIVDEAHLAEHLQQLLSDLAKLEGSQSAPLPPGRRSPVVVALTATGDPEAQRFELGTADYDHPTVAKRLDASKPVHVETASAATTPTKVATEIVSAVKELTTGTDPAVTLVFVNSPTTARLVGKRLGSVDADVEIATGQIRGYEAETVTARILAEARSGANPSVRSKHLVVVATQTLEVGADIDADYLVTEACGVRALTQRLGRLNRLGERPHAKGVYVHTPGKNGEWPVYGEEPAAVVERLQRGDDRAGVVNLSPRKVTVEKVLGEPGDKPDPAPVVAPGLLWEWTKTTTPPPGEAPVDPYFSGYEEQHRRVTVAWRAHLPEPGQKLWPRLGGNETVDVPLTQVVDALTKRGEQDSWLSVDSTNRATASGSPNELRPGDTVLIRPDAGLLDPHGHWEPTAGDLVRDVSVTEAGLPVEPGALKQIYGQPPNKAVGILKEIDQARHDGDTSDVDDLCRRLCATLSTEPPPWSQAGEWADFIASVEAGLDERIRAGQPGLVEPRGEVPHLPLPGRDSRHYEDEELSLSLGEQDPSSLDGHGTYTAQEARRVTAALGLRDPLSQVAVKAARWHDIGKADQRFQRSLNPGRDTSDEPLAKSGQPRSEWATNQAKAGWPRGGRHEELSRRLIEEWLTKTEHGMEPEEAELLQHLVVSHHGRGRPFVPPVADTTCGTTLNYQLEGTPVSVSPDLATPDWNQPTRFAALNARYGPWGLALLEAIVRQSDHIASSAVEVQ